MDQVEEVKSKIDIVTLISEYVKLTKAGRNHKGLCPFHGEKSPSFMVNQELQIYKCFGCGEGGDALSFLQKIEGVEFGEALSQLAKRAGVVLTTYKPTKAEEGRDLLYRINDLAGQYYHYLLTKHKMGKEALKYLTERKITEEAIEKFNLGYAPDGWDYLIEYLGQKKGFKITDLEKAGLVIPSPKGGYDRFRNRVVFPLSNHRGQVVGFAGRVLPGADLPAGRQVKIEQAKYVNTSETEIYHKGDLLYGLDVNKIDIKNAGCVVVVEGEIDAMASWQAGVKNVVAIKGSALTQKQVDLLKRYTEMIVLSLDADVAGDMAARRGIEIAQRSGMMVKITNPKVQVSKYEYKDPGECATADPELWRKIVEMAVPIYDFFISSAIDRHGLDPIGKTKISRELLPIWARIEDAIVAGMYIKRLAEVLGVNEDDVRKQMSKVQDPGSKIQDSKHVTERAAKSRREMLEEYVVGLALRNGKLEELVSEPVSLLFGTEFWKKVVRLFAEQTDRGNIRELISKLPPEMVPLVEEQFLHGEELAFDEVTSEWEKAVKELEEAVVREKLTALRGREGVGDQVAKLVVRLNELTSGR